MKQLPLAGTFRLILISFAGVGLLCSPVAANSVTDLKLETKHTSVYNKISYRIPRGWVVIDGESDWIAASTDKQFWEPGFDPDADTCYSVSKIFPYLTMEDFAEKRVRSLHDLATATLHSLEVAADAKATRDAKPFSLNGNEAISILASIGDSHVHYQIFIRLSDTEVATVSGNGPGDQLDNIRTLVNKIATTVQSAMKKPKRNQ
ncbi:MAG: hypothetical protein ACR2P9_01850 [Gammaproteobacteria bacterium]